MISSACVDWKAILVFFSMITPILVGAFVAWVAYWQLKVNRDKLRLELYNRRFDVYSKTLDFYQVMRNYDGNFKTEDSVKTSQRAFIKASRESQFLFDKESCVFDILNEMNQRTSRMYTYKQGIFLGRVPLDIEKQENEYNEDSTWLTAGLLKMELKMAQYLNFHKQ